MNASPAFCSYYRNKLQVSCYDGRNTVTCNTVGPAPGHQPPPAKTFLIETYRLNTNLNKDWFNLHPEKSTGQGFWDYHSRDPNTGRSTIALHPGSISHGCVTVRESTSQEKNCWNQLKNILLRASRNSLLVTRYNSWWRNYDHRITAVGTLVVY